jgi:hypothetical protein
VYFIKLSTTNYCTHTNININPHLPLKVVTSLIIVFMGFIYRVRWGPLWVGIKTGRKYIKAGEKAGMLLQSLPVVAFWTWG